MNEPSAGKRCIFVHHSVGRYMLKYGSVRNTLDADNIRLWDCDYNKIGTHDGNGHEVEAPAAPDDNTDPGGRQRIFSRGSAQDREFIEWLATFDAVALKSC